MAGGACYKKGHERGLWFEIKCLEATIEAKEKNGQDASFEKEILESYRNFSSEDYDRMLDGRS